MRRSKRRSSVWLGVFLAAAACGTGSSSPTSNANVGFLIGDAPADTLSAFSVRVTTLKFVRSDSTETANLLAVPRTVELLDLVGRSSLLQLAAIPAGTFKGARVGFDPASLTARDLLGAKVNVTAQGSETLTLFETPLALAAGAVLQVRLDVDLEDSISDDGQGGLTFSPSVDIDEIEAESETLDEVHGRVRSAAAGARRLVVQVIDRDSETSVGSLVLQLDDNTALFGESGAAFASEAAFFAAVGARTRIEARGSLRKDGSFLATVVELDSENEGVAAIEGRILSVDSGAGTLQLRILEVKKGRALAKTAFGSAATITVSFAQAIVVADRPTPRLVATSELAAGQKVKVKLSALQSAPFPARRIELGDSRPEFEAAVTDVSGLPGSVVVRLESHDPAIVSGRVASTQTNVTVSLAGSPRIFLKLHEQPVVAAAKLFNGAKVRIRGTVSGSASSPSIAATELRLRPGRLDGVVVSGSSPALTINWTKVDKPFAAQSPANPVLATFASTAAVRGDTTTVAGVFALLASLKAGQSLHVRVFGVSDGQSGVVIHAARVEVK